MWDRSKQQPPKIKKARDAKLNSGRPKHYTEESHKEVWLTVRERMARTGCSAYQVCKDLRVNTYVGYVSDPSLDHLIGGETLRHHYQLANRVPANERKQLEESRRHLRPVATRGVFDCMARHQVSGWDRELLFRLGWPGAKNLRRDR